MQFLLLVLFLCSWLYTFELISNDDLLINFKMQMTGSPGYPSIERRGVVPGELLLNKLEEVNKSVKKIESLVEKSQGIPHNDWEEARQSWPSSTFPEPVLCRCLHQAKRHREGVANATVLPSSHSMLFYPHNHKSASGLSVDWLPFLGLLFAV